jgi:glycosyltransferase involved in cell wall biosynthesis
MARVIMAGTFDPAFARNRKLVRLLELGGHDVETCHVDLWGGKRYEIPNQRKAVVVAHAIAAYPKLVWKFLRVPRGDVVVVAYPGWFDMLVLSLLARVRRMPVVFDVFISLYDTVVSDRKLASAKSPIGRLARFVDRASLRLAQRVLADTPSHADFFASFAGIPRDRIGVVWLGAQDDVFSPHPEVVPQERLVVFHGTFIALQGVDTIIRAAKLLEGDGITFRVIGSGQDQAMVDRLMAELQPSNVELTGLLPLAEVPVQIAGATVCLGIFGASDKAHRVVPNKLYECLAVGRPVVTADTEGARSAFTNREIGLAAAGPEGLANEVRQLVGDPVAREALARAGHERYLAEYSERPLSRLLDAQLAAVRAGSPRA